MFHRCGMLSQNIRNEYLELFFASVHFHMEKILKRKLDFWNRNFILDGSHFCVSVHFLSLKSCGYLMANRCKIQHMYLIIHIKISFLIEYRLLKTFTLMKSLF